MTELRAVRLLRDVPDFPKPGIVFKDITPVLADAAAFQEIIDRMAEWASARAPELVVGVDSRGFLFGAPLALALGVGFAPVRKAGKLPHATVETEYALEYGTDKVQMHADAVHAGQRVLIADDLLATGGTAAASAHLVERLGGRVAGLCFLIELAFLNGRARLPGYDVEALLRYD